MSEFTCSTCKGSFLGLPAMTNACGTFCLTCKHRILQRRMDAGRAPKEFDGRCLWCGEMIPEGKRTSTRPDGEIVHENVHMECRGRRDWILRCIRYSDRVAKYVAAREAEEAPAREARAIEAARRSAAQPVSAAPTASASSLENQVRELREMLSKLLNGGK